MTDVDNIITIFLTVIILLGIFGLIYILSYNNLQAHKIKINEAEGIIDELLRKKYDLLEILKQIIMDNTDIKEKTLNLLVN